MKPHNNFSTSPIPWYVIIAGLTLSFLCPYWFAQFGIDFADTPYHLNNLTHYYKFPFVSFSYWILDCFRRVSGPTVLDYRFFILGLYQVVCSFALVYLKRQQLNSGGKTVFTKGLCLSAIFVNLIIACRMLYIPGYDPLSNAFLVVAFSCMCNYHFKLTKRSLIAAGMISGLCVLARFPNIVMLPIILVWVASLALVTRKTLSSTVINVLVFLVAFGLVFSIGHELLLGRDASSITSSFAKATSHNPNYSFSVLLKKYVIHAMSVFQWLGVMQLIVSLFTEFDRRGYSRKWMMALTAVLINAICFIFFITMGNTPANLLFFLNAGLFYLVVRWIYEEALEFRKVTDQMILAVAILSFAVIPITGSNTGLFKVFTALYLPMIGLLRWRKFDRPMRWTAAVIVSILVVCTFTLRFRQQYEDLPIHRTSEVVNHPKLRGIRTTPSRKKFIEKIITDVENSQVNVMFVGRMRHLFDYLFNIDPGNESMFWGELDCPIYIAQVSDYITKNHVRRIYLIPEYPELLNLNAEQTPMEKMFVEQGFFLTPADVDCKVYAFKAHKIHQL